MIKRKILFLIDSLNSGGAQRQMVTLAANINRSHYEPIVVIYHDLRHFQQVMDKAGVPVVYIKKKYWVDVSYFFALRKFIKSFKPDVILSFLNTANMWARLAGKTAGVKNIITSERNMDIVHSHVRVIVEKLLQRFSSMIIVNAKATAEMMSHNFGIENERLRIIYNGVDVDVYSNPDSNLMNKLRTEFGFRDNDVVLCLPGRLSKQKNHYCLVQAFISIASEHPSTKLLFVGQDDDKTAKRLLLTKISDAGLLDRVLFAGKKSEMPEIYAISNIIILPSLWEGFPNVILEGMASSKPVVASNIADNDVLVKDGKSGFLFQSDNHVLLAEKIDQILTGGEPLMSEMGKEGFKHVKENYSVNQMVKQYEKLFSDLTQE